MAHIDEQLVIHLLGLARLTADEGERKKLLQDVEAILGYVDQLNEVDTEGVAPMKSAAAQENVFRADEPDDNRDQQKAGEPGRITAAFPEDKDGYLKSPPVF